MAQIGQKNSFIRNVSVLATGAGIAQLLPILFMPFITRLYGPEEFGVWGLYTSILAIFGVVATGRYELSIMLPKNDKDSASLVIGAIGVSFLLSIVLFFTIFLFKNSILNFLGNQELDHLLYLLPLNLLLLGMYQSFTYWNNRQKKFKRMAVVRISQSIGIVLGQFAFRKLMQSGGLIVSSVFGTFVAVLVLVENVLYRDKRTFQAVSKNNVLDNLKKYQNFPKFSMWGGLLDSSASQTPIFILNRFFDLVLVGSFSVAMRCLFMPASLISNAVSEVFFQKIVELSQNRPHELLNYSLKVCLCLFLLSLPVGVIFSLWGEDIFMLVLSDKWRQAGILSQTLIWVVVVKFTVSPLTNIFSLEKNIKLGVFRQMIYFISIVTTLLFARNLQLPQFILVFTIHEVVLSGFALLLVLKGVKNLCG